MALYGGPLHVPCVPLGRFVTEKFDEFGDRTALIDPSSGRVFTYRHLSSSVRRLARGLISVGFKKGDILCMFSTNVLEYPVVYFAVASIGGIFQAANPLYNASELQHTLYLCNTAFVVTIPALLSTVKQANFRGEVIVIDGDKGCINYSSLVSEEFSTEPINDGHIDPKNEVGAILFSSGTTGKPKAVQITHYALIVDMDTKKTLPVGENGEVCLRSPAVMKGYKYNPGATAAMLDEDGWLRTGDIGHMDKDGFLYVVDRIKELIKYKGFQVAPAELEDILLSHPDVADAGVIGVPDVEAGELPKAFVARKAGCSVTEQEIQDFVSRKVSGTKRLRGGVTFLSEIPKSASGKILRRLLRDMEKNTRSKL